jgi:hypothetical protein
MKTTSRDCRATLLAALMTSAIAAFCGVLPIAEPTADVAACEAQYGPSPSPSHQWTAARPDSSSADSSDDDDSDNDDAAGAALTPATTTLAADRGRTLLSTPNVVDRRFSLALDGHSLRAPPQ